MPDTDKRRRILEGIQDRVDALTRPLTTRENAHAWDERKARLMPRVVVVEHPSLLEQLDNPFSTGTVGRAAPGNHSRPLANLAAVDLLALIRREASEWARYCSGRPPSPDLPSNLRTLASRAHDLSDDDLSGLSADVLHWWARARAVSGWDVAWRPHVRCMACERLGGIRVRSDPMSAVCLDCGAAWDAATIGILAEHIRKAGAPA